jgi:hypothetical protein
MFHVVLRVLVLRIGQGLTKIRVQLLQMMLQQFLVIIIIVYGMENSLDSL